MPNCAHQGRDRRRGRWGKRRRRREGSKRGKTKVFMAIWGRLGGDSAKREGGGLPIQEIGWHKPVFLAGFSVIMSFARSCGKSPDFTGQNSLLHSLPGILIEEQDIEVMLDILSYLQLISSVYILAVAILCSYIQKLVKRNGLFDLSQASVGIILLSPVAWWLLEGSHSSTILLDILLVSLGAPYRDQLTYIEYFLTLHCLFLFSNC